MRIAEFFAEVGFKWDNIKLKEVVKLIGDLNLSSLTGALSLEKLGGSILKAINETGELASNLENIKEVTGVSPEYIQFLENIAERLRVSKGEADSFLTSLSQLQLNILSGKNAEGAQAFTVLGLNPAQKTEELSKQLAGVLKDPNRLKGWASMFAPDASTAEEFATKFEGFLAAQLHASGGMMRVLKESLNVKPEDAAILPTETLKKSEELTRQWVTGTQELSKEWKEVANSIDTAGISFLKAINKSHVVRNTGKGLGSLVNWMFEDFGTEKAWQVHKLPGFSSAMTSIPKAITNYFYTTVHAVDVEDFAHRFDSVMKKHLRDADSQIGQTVR